MLFIICIEIFVSICTELCEIEFHSLKIDLHVDLHFHIILLFFNAFMVLSQKQKFYI